MEKSLFISSFDSTLYQIYGFASRHLGSGSRYVWHVFFLFFFTALLLLLWRRFGPCLHPRWRHFSMAVMAVFIIRLALFDNPLAWRGYKRVVPSDSLSYLTAKRALDRFRNLELLPRRLDYLIVGSSLPLTALEAFKEMVPNSEYLHVYGMRVMEYVFCEKEVESFKPSRVLLYATIYDLGHVTGPEKYQTFYSLEDLMPWFFKAQSKRLPREARPELYLGKILAGCLFPEYRYSSFFREAVERFLGRPAQSLARGKTPEEVLKIRSDRQIGNVRSLSGASVDINLFFLEEFLRFCREKHIKVIILEGRINPLAETPKSRELSLVAVQKLKQMADKYNHVRFVMASELVRLEAEDFKDMIHVKPESSVKYSQSVLTYLEGAGAGNKNA